MGLQRTYEGDYRDSTTSLERLVPVHGGVAGGEWTEQITDPETGNFLLNFADNYDEAAGDVSPEVLPAAKEAMYRRTGVVLHDTIDVEPVAV